MRTSDFIVNAALLGAGGWVIENTLSKAPPDDGVVGPGPAEHTRRGRYSALFKGERVPFLPVYAFGGGAVMLLAPRLRETELPWYTRAAIYAVTLSAVEYAGCLIDREVLGACSWDYSRKNCADSSRGCVDFGHATLWGMLGLLVEKI